ncbi:Cation/H(+) antiporter 15 [Linum grandiflorum]
MEATNPTFWLVNWNVSCHAPCSVGILVDRGLSGAGYKMAAATNQISHNVAVLFFGGPNDQEAMSYAWRMSEHPGIVANNREEMVLAATVVVEEELSGGIEELSRQRWPWRKTQEDND